jgi:hypothetical protein
MGTKRKTRPFFFAQILPFLLCLPSFSDPLTWFFVPSQIRLCFALVLCPGSLPWFFLPSFLLSLSLSFSLFTLSIYLSLSSFVPL